MDDQKIWNIINSHFKDNYQSLVKHHIDSYNDFFENKIYDIFKQENPISFMTNYDNKLDEHRNICEIYLGGKDGKRIYFGKPVLYENDKSKYMYPNDCRLRNMSYAMTIHYDVEIYFKKILKDGETPEIIGGNYQYINDNEKIHNVKFDNYDIDHVDNIDGGAKPNKQLLATDLTAMETARLRELTEKSLNGNIQQWTMVLEKQYLGKFPIMIQSNFCILNGLPKEIRSSMGECRNDVGGYFIIEGKEKTVVSQEKFADNMLYIKKDLDDKYLFSAEMRSVSEVVSKPKRTISIKIVAPSGKLTNENIVVNVPQLKKPIPLFILFRALGVISDKDIISHCLLDLDKNKRFIDLFIPSVHDSGGIFTQKMALKYMATLGKYKTIPYVWEILSDYFFPHIGETTYKQKALFLGHIVFQLLKVFIGDELPTDRDNYKYKRIELVGSLINDLFLECYRKQLKKIRVYIDTPLSTNKGIYENDLQGLINNHYKNAFSKKILEKCFKDAFKGNWGTEKHTKRIGVVQDLNRLSHNSMLSHLRKTNLPLDSTAKVIGPRLLNGSQWGYFDPVDTPDGGNIGLHKHLSISTYITKGISREPLIKWCLKNISLKLIEDCNFHELNTKTKIIINGCWIGMIDNPIQSTKKIKHYRRNALIPIYISISFNITSNTIFMYTDGGRLCRPLFYVDNDKLSYDNTNILNKLDEEFNWNNLICGFNTLKDKDFNPNNYKFYNIDELYNVANSEIDIFKNKRFTTDKSIIEYIDSSETEDALIALNSNIYDKKQKKYTHLEIHESFILGVMGNLIIYPENNPGTRNMFSCGQSRQACSLYSTNYQLRMDKTSVVLNQPEIPIVKTRYMEHINSEENCYGENIIVAIMCYTGYNVEDAVLINEASLNRGLFNTTYYSCYETHEEKKIEDDITSEINFYDVENIDNVKGKTKDVDYSKLNKYGIIPENTHVNDETAIIGMLSSNSKNYGVFTDISKKPKKGQIGIVDKSFISENEEGQRLAKVKIREFRQPKIGDKMGSRCGQKGTVGLIVPERDMPFTKNGQRPDMIINPHALPSRMTIGQLIETVTGKTGLLRGGFIDCTAFINKNNKFKLFAETLVKDGYHSSGNEILYDGFTGKQIETEIFIGPTYYMRLKHMVKDKINFRSTGPNTNLTRQPVSGRANDGGLRIGEMERDVLISHGTSNFLTESMMERGDKYHMAVCNKTGTPAIYNYDKDLFYSVMSDGPTNWTNVTKFSADLIKKTKFGRDFSIVKVPYCFKLLEQELGACNIKMRIITEDNINNFDSMFYSDNISKLLNKPMTIEESVDDVLLINKMHKNNKKVDYLLNMNKSDKEIYDKENEEYRENPFFIHYFEKFPNSTWEEARKEYDNFLLTGQSKLIVDDDLIQDGWTKQFSTKHDRSYWFNIKSGETTWTKPILDQPVTIIEDPEQDDSPPWAPSDSPAYVPLSLSPEDKQKKELDEIETKMNLDDSPPYAPDYSDTHGLSSSTEFKLSDKVYLRSDLKPNRIWNIKNISDNYITIYTEDNEGLTSEETIKVVREMEIYKMADYSTEVMNGGKKEHNNNNNNNNDTPTINIAPVFKIMNAGGDHSDNKVTTENMDDSGSNILQPMVVGNKEESNGGSIKVEEPITDNSKIDFNKLVIKKV
jgi:DNA-directed RNA polymerase II subunit RPB2